MTTQRSFYVAGWVSVLGAVATIVGIVLMVAAMVLPENALLMGINEAWSVMTAALGLYMLVALRRLLHTRAFHAADVVLSLLISGIVVGTVLQVVGGLVLEPTLAGALLIVFAVAYGLVTAVLGYKVLPAEALIAGPVRPFAYLSIICGVGIATLILFPIGVLASVASDISLALMFFRASAVPAADTSDQWSPQA
jgi:hypothetical protein